MFWPQKTHVLVVLISNKQGFWRQKYFFTKQEIFSHRSLTLFFAIIHHHVVESICNLCKKKRLFCIWFTISPVWKSPVEFYHFVINEDEFVLITRELLLNQILQVVSGAFFAVSFASDVQHLRLDFRYDSKMTLQ